MIEMVILLLQATEVHIFFGLLKILLKSFVLVWVNIWMQHIFLLFTRMYLDVVIYSMIAFSFMKIHFDLNKNKIMKK